MQALIFDIETIPQTNISAIQEEELAKKLDSYLSKRSDDENHEEAKRLLMGTSPYFGEIVCIGLGVEDAMGNLTTGAYIGPEIVILEKFWRYISKKPYIYVSFNGLEFDVPFITARSMKHRIPVSNKAFIDTRRYQKYPHFDIKQVMSDWDRYKSCTLQLACDHLGIPSPKNGEIAAKDVAQAYADGRIEEIKEYCIRDIVATHQVYKIVKDYTIIK